MKLNDLGNIYSSGNAFTTKAALLQSKYRVENNLPIGETTVSVPDGFDASGKPQKKKIRKQYGHIVKDGETSNKNFYNDDIFKYAHQRVNEKKPEETIKADRLFNNLLSSMPLAFNLFYPLMQLLKIDVQKASEIIASLFPNLNIERVDKIEIEFIPTPITNYTNDKSAMDAVVFFTDKNGGQNIIAIEVKYTDSLGTNKASENQLKYEVAKDSKLFTEAGLKQIEAGCTQIFRNFLLTEKYRMVHNLANSYNVILAPTQHPSTESEINAIKKYFSEQCPKDKLIKYDLESFTKTIEESAPTELKQWLTWFRNRYLMFNQVEELFKALK
jgi:hypothetical protein